MTKSGRHSPQNGDSLQEWKALAEKVQQRMRTIGDVTDEELDVIEPLSDDDQDFIATVMSDPSGGMKRTVTLLFAIFFAARAVTPRGTLPFGALQFFAAEPTRIVDLLLGVGLFLEKGYLEAKPPGALTQQTSLTFTEIGRRVRIHLLTV